MIEERKGPRRAPARANRGPAAGPENRRALIAAAREVYAEEGLGAPFSAVARRAGVGQGSLYRHFPDKTSLAVAVFEDNVAELEELVGDTDRRLSDLFDGIVDQAMVSTALIDLTIANRHDPGVRHLGERFAGVIGSLLDREHRAGRIGAHVDVQDVMLAAGMLAAELARTEPDDRPDTARRVRAMFRRSFAPTAG